MFLHWGCTFASAKASLASAQASLASAQASDYDTCQLVVSSPAIHDMTHSYVLRMMCICDMTHSYV